MKKSYLEFVIILFLTAIAIALIFSGENHLRILGIISVIVGTLSYCLKNFFKGRK